MPDGNNFVRSQLSFLTSESFVRVVGYEGAQAINIRLQVNITEYRLHITLLMVTMCETHVCPRCGPCMRRGSWCSTSSAPAATSSCSWWAELSGNQSHVLRY